MFDAQTLFGGSTIYSPWFRRQGENVRINLEVVAISGATIKVKVYTKALEDKGIGAVVDGDLSNDEISSTAVGITTMECAVGTNALSELVRYRFEVTGTSDKWVLFRMLAPVWFDSVKA